MHAGIDVHAVFKPGDVIKAVVTSISEEDRPRRKLARPQGAGAGLLNTQRDTGSKGGAGRQQHEVKLRITLATEPLELFPGAMLEDAQAVYADAVAAQRALIGYAKRDTPGRPRNVDAVVCGQVEGEAVACVYRSRGALSVCYLSIEHGHVLSVTGKHTFPGMARDRFPWLLCLREGAKAADQREQAWV